MSEAGMETIAARLASFSVSHRPVSKGRTSGARAKPITWPHASPSPAELAHAGFYYQPTDLSPDNTACFLCRYALDGWEEDDDPITEHLRHSRECGWAIMMDILRHSSNPTEIIDPTSVEIAEARRATFGTWWPYDGKKGWKCKTEKMVEAGWYFCANEESNDFVSCAYCNLSLDGWEPNDDPFDEHYRRSSECSFFHFASMPGKKAKSARGRSSRSSKASRASTQSTISTASTAETIDFDTDMENSVISQTVSEVPKKKGRGRKPKAKKDSTLDTNELSDRETHADDPQIKKPRGRKRKSVEIAEPEAPQGTLYSDTENSEPPTKKRATGTRKASASKTRANSNPHSNEEREPHGISVNEKQSSRKNGRTRSTSADVGPSTVSRPSLSSLLSDDMEIEAELEAELKGDVFDREKAHDDSFNHGSVSGSTDKSTTAVMPKRKASKKGKSADNPEHASAETTQKQTRKKAPAKKKTSKKASASSQGDAVIDSDIQYPALTNNVYMDVNNSEIVSEGPAPRMTQESHTQDESLMNESDDNHQQRLRGRQEPVNGAESSPDALASRDSISSRISMNASFANQDGITKNRTITDSKSRLEPRQSQTRKSHTQTNEKPRVHIYEEYESSPDTRPSVLRNNVQSATNTNVSDVRPQMQERTPSPSPQSSDAENRPPSSKPSTNQKKPHVTKIHAEPSTPLAATKQGFDLSIDPKTPDPWKPIDLDDLVLPDSANKENIDLSEMLHAAKDDLTSPEKRMRVDEWISWNAKKGESKLRGECERLVSLFEKEGGRAMRVLEEIECID